ncbi:MAG: hypothetical protein AB7U62_12950, partial [Pseudolabrys sp.]
LSLKVARKRRDEHSSAADENAEDAPNSSAGASRRDFGITASNHRAWRRWAGISWLAKRDAAD